MHGRSSKQRHAAMRRKAIQLHMQGADEWRSDNQRLFFFSSHEISATVEVPDARAAE